MGPKYYYYVVRTHTKIMSQVADTHPLDLNLSDIVEWWSEISYEQFQRIYEKDAAVSSES